MSELYAGYAACPVIVRKQLPIAFAMERIVLRSFWIILLLTGIMKLVGSIINAPLAHIPHPLLGISNRWFLLFAGAAECIIALMVARLNNHRTKAAIILWVCGLKVSRAAF